MSQTGPAEVVDALVRPDYHVSREHLDEIEAALAKRG
jgi:hypothetical protein